MTTKPLLIVLVGFPATGKSTFREALRLRNGFSFMAISSDDYIDHEARLQGKTYTEVFDKAVGPANVAIEADAKAAKMLGANVVWDQTNLTVKKRKIILDKFKDYDKVCVYFPIPNDWYNRLDKRAEVEGKLIPHNVLGSMQDCFESPRLSEGFSWIHTPESFLKYFENLMVSN